MLARESAQPRRLAGAEQLGLGALGERHEVERREASGPRPARRFRPGARGRTRGSSPAARSAAARRSSPGGRGSCPRVTKFLEDVAAAVASAASTSTLPRRRPGAREATLGVVEQLVAPVDRGAQRPLAARRVGGAAGEQRAAPVEPPESSAGASRPRARRPARSPAAGRPGARQIAIARRSAARPHRGRRRVVRARAVARTGRRLVPVRAARRRAPARRACEAARGSSRPPQVRGAP